MDESTIMTNTAHGLGRIDRRKLHAGLQQLALLASIIAIVMALVVLRHGADPMRHVRIANMLALTLAPLIYLSIRLREAPGRP